MNNLKKTTIAAAIITVLGASSPASAASGGYGFPRNAITADYSGWFTLLTTDGDAVFVNGDAAANEFYGNRTAISGSLEFDAIEGTGSATIAAFSFAGSGFAEATNFSLQSVGNNLLLGNMTFNWSSGGNGFPISIVLDASGLLGAMDGSLNTSDTISGVGALAATDDFLFGASRSYTLPLGSSPLATTTFNTTDIGTIALGANPSGTLPFTDDGIGGSPMKTAPFPGWYANFDITELHVTEYIYTPIPAAVWLFGSGLLGLIGIARRRKG